MKALGPLTEKEAWREAVRICTALEGQLIVRDVVMGYVENHSVVVELDVPAVFYVWRITPEQDFSIGGGYLDTNIDVHPAEPVPQLDGVRSLWVDGPSIQLLPEEKI